jgi:hypothetical protein
MQNLWKQSKSGGFYNRDRKDIGIELALAQN